MTEGERRRRIAQAELYKEQSRQAAFSGAAGLTSGLAGFGACFAAVITALFAAIAIFG